MKKNSFNGIVPGNSYGNAYYALRNCGLRGGNRL